MALVDVVKWDAGDEAYAWKFPSQELSTWTQLIVSESQEAVLLSGGVMDGPFGPGRHTLSTANIPVLVNLMKLPFGGKSPFTAEVWFVNRSIPLDIKWGTSDPIQVQDPKYDIMLPVRAFGQFAVQITDTKVFLKKMVGTMPSFDRQKLVSYFRGLMLTRVKDCIARHIVKEKISILEIAASMNSISSTLQNEMDSDMVQFGLHLVNFYVNSINTPEDDPAVEKLKTALAKKAEMNIIGYTYQQERSFDTVQTAAGNEGAASSSLMNAGMGLGMGAGMGGAFGGMMGAMTQNMQPQTMTQQVQTCQKCHTQNPVGAKFCSGCGGPVAGQASSSMMTCDKCGTKATKGSKFCPNCADPFFCCPSCGEDNPAGVSKCLNCSAALPVKCSNCGNDVAGGTKFCPHCGKSLVKNCSKCSMELSPEVKYCPNCGNAAE